MGNPIFFTKAPPLSDPRSNFQGFQPGTQVLPRGKPFREGFKPLECDIILERDVPATMRDGTVLRIDVYRPDTTEPVPAILCSSIFGKNGPYRTYDMKAEQCGHPNRLDVPKSGTSGIDQWECPDPGFWCTHGYAVVYMDPRGVGMSEGDAHYFGTQDATDNYDVIEFLARQLWCSGKISMGGNSWLGITQWFTAALHPPHLVCIAPWEGHGNMYVDEYMRGGIPHISIVRLNMCYGNNRMEDLPAAMRAYPLMNDFWAEKAVDHSKITIPAYVVASYSSQVHCRGTFEGFRSISSQEKWLRVHARQEWCDLHDPQNQKDLLKFLDHYCKGIDNGWEKTPRVRLAVLDPGHTDIVGREEECFPLEREVRHKLHLDCLNGKLAQTPPAGVFQAEYVSDDGVGKLQFRYTFQEETEITGYIKLHLWAAAQSHYDMDVYAKLSKLDTHGSYVFNDGVTYQYGGPNAMLRASLRELDPKRSTQSEPVHTFRHPQLLTPGVPVCLELGFWPTSLLFHPGESLELTLAGFDYLGLHAPEDNVRDSDNLGRHIIYSGGTYDSYLDLPFIPVRREQTRGKAKSTEKGKSK